MLVDYENPYLQKTNSHLQYQSHRRCSPQPIYANSDPFFMAENNITLSYSPWCIGASQSCQGQNTVFTIDSTIPILFMLTPITISTLLGGLIC
jgi:hypothetical protein